MRSAFLSFTLPLTLLALLGSSSAREIVIPAGTLLQCTLDEPNFSSATADVGDPVLCHPRSVQTFGQAAFPRGTYLVGHLEAEKNPGHFVGKGYLKLEFDRIGLPNNDVALPGKIVAAKGYHVDREGKIIGKGHPTRDAVEWMIPPLWPWKIITLPARGPRPTLKGETTITMRIMDDVVIPQNALYQWHRFGQPPSTEDAYDQPSAYRGPRASARSMDSSFTARTVSDRTSQIPTGQDQSAQIQTAQIQTEQDHTGLIQTAQIQTEQDQPVQQLPVQEQTGQQRARQDQTDAVPVPKPVPSASLAVLKTVSSGADVSQAPALSWHYYGQRTSASTARPDAGSPQLTLFALNSGSVYAVTDYWVDNGSLTYVLSKGGQGAVSLQDIDWESTTKLNSERNVKISLKSTGQNN